LPVPYRLGNALLYAGDCRTILPALDPVDAIVTDPPYGLEFMGRDWDKLDAGLPQENVWKGRRGKGGSTIGDDDSKPGSRHHVSYGVRRAGFKRCRKCGKRQFSGSPCQCAEPDWIVEFNDGPPSSVVRIERWHEVWAREAYRVLKPGGYLLAFGGTRTHHRLFSAIENAGFVIQDTIAWLYGTGFPKGRTQLKPAFEPIVVAYKPGGPRALSIDECRIAGVGNKTFDRDAGSRDRAQYRTGTTIGSARSTELGRWPANVAHDGSDEVLEAFAAFGERDSGGPARKLPGHFARKSTGFFSSDEAPSGRINGHQDTGTAARFFYCAKASKADRAGSKHPTIKPVALLRWLVRLVTPPGGLVLDPFAGSGTIGVAALAEGRRAILIEREAEYIGDIRRRLRGKRLAIAA
jgi:site-specific DNA-methyltransferase (adenine-specific)